MEVHPISTLLRLPLPVYEVARSSNYDRVICCGADKGILGPVNVAGFGRVLGLGHDLVDLQEFGRQLAMPGTRMSSLFSTWERRQAERRCSSMITQRRTRHALGPEPSPYCWMTAPGAASRFWMKARVGRASARSSPWKLCCTIACFRSAARLTGFSCAGTSLSAMMGRQLRLLCFCAGESESGPSGIA